MWGGGGGIRGVVGCRGGGRIGRVLYPTLARKGTAAKVRDLPQPFPSWNRMTNVVGNKFVKLDHFMPSFCVPRSFLSSLYLIIVYF